MSIKEKLKSDQLAARKARDTKLVTYLSTIIGEIETKDKIKPMTDSDVIALLKKFKDGIDETVNKVGTTDTTSFELNVIKQYMPQQLSVQEIKQILGDNNITNIKDAQQYMRANHAGMYNGKDVNSALQ